MMLCIGTAMFSMFFFLTQYLQNVLGWSAIRTGVGFLPMTLGIIAAAVLASRMIGKIGIRIPLLVGPAAAVVGLELLTRLTIHSGYGSIVVPLLIVSLGMGLSFVPLTLAAVSGVQPSEAGLASALLNTTQQVGGALGLAILSTISIDAFKSKLASFTTSSQVTSHQAMNIATTHGYTTAFQVGAFIAFAGLIISAVVIRTPKELGSDATAVLAAH
jgi:predicted MFS family arabinose efflux permease